MGRRGASRKSPNKGGPPIEVPSLWGAGVQAESLLIKEALPLSYLLYGARGCKQKVC